MTKIKWHTEPPKGENRPLWVTCENRRVDWFGSRMTEIHIKEGWALAWAEYTSQKPEPYDPISIALKGWEEPTEEDIHNACLSFDHSYHFWDTEDKEMLKIHAKEWLRAWRHTLND